MNTRWAPLYLVAVERLGDESRAGDMILSARSEADLERILRAFGPLPTPLPDPPIDIVRYVDRLRLRAAKRKRLALFWAGLGLAVLAAALSGLALRYRAKPVVAAAPAELVIPVEQTLLRDGYGVYIKSVVLKPEATVVEWTRKMPAGSNGALASFLAISGISTEAGTVPQIRMEGGTLTEFGALPSRAERVTLQTGDFWPTQMDIRLEEGEASPDLSVRVRRVTRTDEEWTVELITLSELTPVSVLLQYADREERPAGYHVRSEGGTTMMLVTFPAPRGETPTALRLLAVRQLPPLELTIPVK